MTVKLTKEALRLIYKSENAYPCMRSNTRFERVPWIKKWTICEVGDFTREIPGGPPPDVRVVRITNPVRMEFEPVKVLLKDKSHCFIWARIK